MYLWSGGIDLRSEIIGGRMDIAGSPLPISPRMAPFAVRLVKR
jgi:hypothetical protein